MIELLHTFFQSVAEFFSSIWSWITFAIGEIVDFFQLIGSGVKFVIGLFDLIPPVFKIFGLITIAVLIIYVIIGRESGG